MTEPLVVHVAITFADGSLGVMQFVTHDFGPAGSVRRYCPATPDAIQREIERSAFGQPVISWRPIDPSDLPVDRTYRGAWVDNGQRIVHDLAKAQALAVARLRNDREPLFAKLDADWMQAFGQNDTETAAKIERKRQLLRDAPAVLRAAAAGADSLDAITASIPDLGAIVKG